MASIPVDEVFLIALVKGNNVRYLDADGDWVPDPELAERFNSKRAAETALKTIIEPKVHYRIDTHYVKE